MGKLARLSAFILILAALCACARGQTADTSWGRRLVDMPLYLKGLWQADKLHFDGAGKLIEPSSVGSATLSGIDVEHVTQSGSRLVVEGVRVALVARSGDLPGLEREKISSTTHIAFSLRRGDKSNFHAPEHMQITIEADSQGSYDVAVDAIFANGLAVFSRSLPLYWECYARSYLVPAQVSAQAEQDVQRCVITPTGSSGDELQADGATPIVPPKIVSSIPPILPPVTSSLGVKGTAIVHLRVREDGVPVGLQIVRAVGGGGDELLLQAVSRARFQPATRNGVAVPFNMNLSFRIQPQ